MANETIRKIEIVHDEHKEIEPVLMKTLVSFEYGGIMSGTTMALSVSESAKEDAVIIWLNSEWNWEIVQNEEGRLGLIAKY